MNKYPKYISEEQQEQFESYLLGEMTMEEKASFEINLKKDRRLQEAFNEFKSLFQTIEEAGIRSKLDDFHKAVDENRNPVRRLDPPARKFNYRIAATVAILLTLGGFWFFNSSNPNERLFDKYYTQDPGLPTVMGSNENYAFYEAMVDYKQRKYDVAILKWEKLLQAKPENDTLNYFLGTAHLGSNEFEQALEYLLRNESKSSSNFYKETQFYLGMTYLKLDKVSKAKTHFEKSKMSVASEILESIEEK